MTSNMTISINEGYAMKQHEIAAAAMASAELGALFGPAQIQKLMFLIDAELAGNIGGPFFEFLPYDYGPFDSAVYSAVNRLKLEGLLATDLTERYRRYFLTGPGHEAGQQHLNQLDEGARDFIARAARWVREVSFSQLVSAIYERYPEMKENSIFRSPA